MKLITSTVLGAGLIALLSSTSAHAVLIDAKGTGIDYTLTETIIDADTRTYNLTATNLNTALDTEGGRTGVNSVAFQQPDNFLSASVINPPGFNFVIGGLNASGCNEDGNFFCFDNPAIVGGGPVPGPLLGSTFSMTFVVNTTGAFDTSYDPSMKIDWVGTQNNYDLISLVVGISPPPPDDDPPDDDPPNPIPEPGSLIALGTGMLAMAGFVGWRRRKNT